MDGDEDHSGNTDVADHLRINIHGETSGEDNDVSFKYTRSLNYLDQSVPREPITMDPSYNEEIQRKNRLLSYGISQAWNDQATTDLYVQTAYKDSTQTTSFALDYINVQNVSFIEGLSSSGDGFNCTNNFTLCFDYNDSTIETPTALDNSEQDNDHTLKYWVLVLLIIPLFTIFGNLLVCLAVYKERQLHTVTNYFIVSLAVADIMVAALVMPLAIYVEVTGGKWFLGARLCDMYVAFDVMCCTASILNLTAISIDRFLAVTRPIQYATYKTSNRVWIMLAGVWLVSIAISSPIPLGMNYTDLRKDDICSFFNANFIIYSSLGSFWIPCVVMVILYYRIFKVIRDRGIRAKQRARAQDAKTYRNVKIIENKAHTARSSSENSHSEENANTKNEMTVLPNTYSTHLTVNTPLVNHCNDTGNVSSNNHSSDNNFETSFMNRNVKFSGTDTDTPNCKCQKGACLITSEEEGEEGDIRVITNQKCEIDGVNHQCPHLNLTSDDDNQLDCSNGGKTTINKQYIAPSCVETTIQEPVTSPATYSNKTLLSPPPPRKNLSLFTEHKPKAKSKRTKNNHHGNNSPRKYVTKFNFNIRHNGSRKKKKDRSTSNKKERKATRTLAIVLGMFLLCWVPFFTINIMNAICIKFDMVQNPAAAACQVDPYLVSVFVWLGYINSFMNPVIYTIFNIEFRKAFKKLVTQPC